MTLNVRSSSLNDTTRLQRRLAMAGLVAATIVVLAVAVQVAPSIRLGAATTTSDGAAGLAAQRNDEIMAGATSAGIAAYRAGEIGLGSVLVGDKALHWGWQQAASQAVDRAAIDAGRHRAGRHPAKHPLDEAPVTHPSGLFRGR